MCSSLFNIEKLDESNYDSWNLQLQSVLVHQELWPVTCGELPAPKEGADEKAVLLWKAKDDKAKATIILSITPMQISHIKNCKSANEAWKCLQEVHRPKGPVRKVTLFKQLLGIRMNDGECVQQYVCKFTAVAEKLAEIGVCLQDDLFVIMLLASLPKSFESLVVALESRDELPNLTAVKIKLIEEGERRKTCQSEHTEGSVQAFVAHANTNAKKNIFEHTKSNDSASTASTRKDNSKKSNLKCYSCGKKGHFAAQCKGKDREKSSHQNVTRNGLFAAVSSRILHNDVWCVDSGASSHLCCNRNMFDEFEPCEESIMLAAEHKILAKGKGVVRLRTNEFDVTLVDVLFVPGLQCNFVSVARAVNSGYIVEFKGNTAKFFDKHGGIILCAQKVRDLYLLEINKNKLFFAKKIADDVMKWHNRFGHLNFASLRQLSNKQMVFGLPINIPTDVNCALCMSSKCTQRPYSNSQNYAADVLGVVHTDVCGPVNVASIGGARYFLTFMDDKTRYIFVYFLRHKSEVFEKFKEFKAMAERQTGEKLKILRSDNGTEFVNNIFDEYLKANGILRQLTVPYTPQQNGAAERLNRTLLEMARCMLLGAGLEQSLWGEAVSTSAYLRNRSPTKALDSVTPYEAWHGHKPTVAHLRAFGSFAVALDKRQRDKFKPKGKEYVMVGYSDTSKAYRLYDKEAKRLIVSRDVYFIEQTQHKQQHEAILDVLNPINVHVSDNEQMAQVPVIQVDEANDNANEDEVVDDGGMQPEKSDDDFESPEDEPTSLKRGPGRPKLIRTGVCGRPKKQYNYLSLLTYGNIKVPDTVGEALSSELSGDWYNAMKAEYESLLKNKTWELVKLPRDQKPVRNKWVFAVKRNKDGNVERFKARLVAKGCSQIYGVNYTETFSPVVRYNTIRMIFAIAAEYRLHLHQMDVSTAYLNSDLSEDIYMNQPEMFVDKRYPDHCLKLKKALYGLKQSGRQWNMKLDSILKQIGFKQCECEPCVYVMHKGKQLNIIAVYVDDLLIASSDYSHLKLIKAMISNKVEVVDKGQVQHFLSMEVERDGETGAIAISQKGHIKRLLREYEMENCRPIAIPLDPGHQVVCNEQNCKKADQVQYQSLIGSLMYLAVCTRPDILHSVCKLAQRNNDPHVEHLSAAKRILRFLCTTQDMQLRYNKTGKPIECFVDSDWGGDTSDRKSYTGYAVMLAGGVFSYECKKQTTIALSSTEAEYMALACVVKEAVYLKQLLTEMELECPDAMIVNGDNLSAMNLVKNPVYHARSKHIDIKYHFIRNIYRGGEIELNYCSTSNMIADIFTKNLARPNHEKFSKMLNLC